MAARLEAMKKADASYDAGMRSHSGLTGGDGAKMDAYAANGGGICGEFIDGHSCRGAAYGRVQRLHALHRRRADGGRMRSPAGGTAAVWSAL